MLRLRPKGMRHRHAIHSVSMRVRPHQGLGRSANWAGRKSSRGIKRDGAERQHREDENSASRFFKGHFDSPSIGSCDKRFADFDKAVANLLEDETVVGAVLFPRDD